MRLQYSETELTKVTRLIDLLEQWISTADDAQLREQCRKSGSEFFGFLKSKGYSPGEVSNRVRRFIGYSPRSIPTAKCGLIVLTGLRTYEYVLIQCRTTGHPVEAILRQQGL